MKTSTVVLIGVILVVGAGLVLGWRGLGRDDRQVLRVMGEARLVGEPNVARLRFGVEKSGKTVVEAQARVNAVVNKVVAAVQAAGVKKEDVATSDLSIAQGWDYRHDRPSGYDVSSTLTITVRNVQWVGEAIDRGVAVGLNRLQGISYAVEGPEWRRKAWRNALGSAREKAQNLAAGLGQPLGRVISVQEVGAEQTSPLILDDYVRNRNVWMAPLAESAGERTRALPGQRTMTVQVVVEYAL